MSNGSAVRVEWSDAWDDLIPLSWFERTGHFLGRHLMVSDQKRRAWVDCHLDVLPKRAVLTYTHDALGARLQGIERGQLHVEFTSRTRRSVRAVRWLPHGKNEYHDGKAKQAPLPERTRFAELRPAVGDGLFVQGIEDLLRSVRTFASASVGDQRNILDSNPRYFVHTRSGLVQRFGLSKFVVLNDTTPNDYLGAMRWRIEGTPAQRYIAKLTGQEWSRLDRVSPRTRRAFIDWFTPLRSTPVDPKNIWLMSLVDRSMGNLNDAVSVGSGRRRRKKTLDELERQLSRQRELGAIGETIAMAYEANRLRGLGIEPRVKQVSGEDVGAGFDIQSHHPTEGRCIEVKASKSADARFYISLGELDELRRLGRRAYLYFVRITGEDPPKGVVEELQDPARFFDREKVLEPAAWQGNWNSQWSRPGRPSRHRKT